MKSTYMLYDRERLDLQVPDHWSILEPADPPAVGDLAAAIEAALEKPIGSDPLSVIVRRADKAKPAVIVISDITRAVPNRDFLPVLIRMLKQGGFEDSQITILVATGTHRPSTREEHIELVGPEIAQKYKIIDHRARDPETLVDLPNRTSAGTAVRIDATYFNAGLRILTGFIEPHFMAGFSGGRKSICPGLVDLVTLQIFHGYKFLADPRARAGNLDGNPGHLEALDVARMVRPDFIFNVTVNAHGKTTGIFAGDMEKAHEAGAEFVRKTMTIRVDRPFDVVFTSGGGYPLDTTFYQAVKGMVIANEYVRPGGTVVICSGCKQGYGPKTYRDLMFRYTDYKTFLGEIARSNETQMDQWEFQMHTRVLEKVGLAGLIMACDHIEGGDLRRSFVTTAADRVGPGPVREQIGKLVGLFAAPGLRVAVLPRGPYILPEISN
jgi:lactate racemase